MTIFLEKKIQFEGHKGSVYALSNSDKANIFYSGGSDNIVLQWDINNPQLGIVLAKTNGQILSILHHKSTNHLFIATMNGGFHLVDLNEKKELHYIIYEHSSIFNLQSFQNESKVLAASKTGTLSLWDSTNLKLLSEKKLSTESIRSIAISHDKKTIAAGSSDSKIYILDTEFNVLKELETHSSSVFSLAFSLDGKYLLSGSRDAQLAVWDVENGFSLLQKIPAHLYTINQITFHPNGEIFATASRDKTIKLWSAGDFKLLKVIDRERLGGHTHSVNNLLWVENGKYLISCGDDKVVIAWTITFE
jgi:WD repeat-containing protein 61